MMKNESGFPNVTFESEFVENAVFLTIRSLEKNGNRELTGTFYRERDRIYENDSGECRDRLFRKMYDDFFHRLGLAAIFLEAVSSYPILKLHKPEFFIRRAWRAKEEGSELYLRNGTKLIVIRIQTARILEKSDLNLFLHHELLHLADMLDPAFGYQPDPDLGGVNEIEDNIIRERFRILWDLYVSARNEKRGLRAFIPRERAENEFDSAFSFISAREKETVFQNITSGGKKFTQDELIRFARDERILRTMGEGGRLCPLCQFPSEERVNEWNGGNGAILEEIKRDKPGWDLSGGICRQCFELYRSKQVGVR